MMELVFRFVVGGMVVSLFAVIADILKPKSFAGLFGAAPSVALTTLALTIATDGKTYAALEARSMIVGACAFFVYACLCMRLMTKHKARATPATVAGLAIWLVCALGGWFVFLK
jgi:uncharacterized membrane protein (GlpM family)